MTDHADGLPRLEEAPNERDGVLVGAHEVRVRHASREHQPVIRRDLGIGRGGVDLEGVGLVEVLEALDLTGLEGHELRRPSRTLDSLPRLGQLHLLHAVGGEELRCACHPGCSSSLLSQGALGTFQPCPENKRCVKKPPQGVCTDPSRVGTQDGGTKPLHD